MLPTFIIDFDSTFVTVEALEELAAITLDQHEQKENILKEIADITKAGMEGTIDFPTALSKRIALFKPTNNDIAHVINLLKNYITPSVLRNRKFFQKYHENIYIISGGFREYILPVATDFGITESHVLANTFRYDEWGEIVGVDNTNPLSQTYGKVKAVAQLQLSGEICVIGDGITDYQVKEQEKADRFFAFVENVTRKGVAAKADKIIKNFDELLYIFDLPRSQSYPTSKMKVLLLENINQATIERFVHEGYAIEVLEKALSEEELIEKIPEISILGIRSKTEITQKVISRAKKLLAIGTFCIGSNQVDLSEATKKGIAVFNAPYSSTRSVAELVLGEIIMLYRKIFDENTDMHRGKWSKSGAGSFEIRGKKLGIVGYGNIGAQLSVLAENMGMQVYFYDVVDKLVLGNARKCQSLQELLRTCDVITIHVDGAQTNKNLIGKKEFEQMRDGALFLNLSRGHVVDIPALAQAIRQGKLAGCAVDVFPNEPASNTDPFTSPLQGLPNVILTPHIGGSTEEAQENIGEFVSNKIIQYINTGSTLLSVNFPGLALPEQRNTHRFIHIHNNVPGILSHINHVLAHEKANIEGQYLKTNEKIGYVITDLNAKHNNNIVRELTTIPGTVKARVLY